VVTVIEQVSNRQAWKYLFFTDPPMALED
jgi:hypothetical protein